MIGTVIGILPGLGGSTANILSYVVAKNTSKHPEAFGTGIVDGIVASETANNAAVGGALVPLLTLGIPGDTFTAMLIGAFMIHGITPGPLLFKTNGPLVYAIFAALIVANILMVVFEYGFMIMKSLSIFLKNKFKQPTIKRVDPRSLPETKRKNSRRKFISTFKCELFIPRTGIVFELDVKKKPWISCRKCKKIFQRCWRFWFKPGQCMGKPSKTVVSDDAVPGTPIRMAEINPPEQPPTKIPMMPIMGLSKSMSVYPIASTNALLSNSCLFPGCFHFSELLFSIIRSLWH